MEWISVKDQEPSCDFHVMVFLPADSGYIGTGYLSIGGWEVFGYEGCGYDVTHWMPLPEPPKRGE